MSASSTFFTVDTVSGSFSRTSTFDPSRVLMVRVWPSTAAMVPRIRVGGAFCARAAVAHRQAASASGISRANIILSPLGCRGCRDDGDDPGFWKGAYRLCSWSREDTDGTREIRGRDPPQSGLHHVTRGAGHDPGRGHRAARGRVPEDTAQRG